MTSVGALTANVKTWPWLNGPLPVLLSVALALRLKLPDAVGVPDTVTLSVVLPVMASPAGNPATL
jgi:hypothetical protein